jgi:tetratricopeptide (TPR) repeat protein
VRTYERRQLKQDAFATRTGETLSWVSQNRNHVTLGVVIIVVILVAILGGRWYLNFRNHDANQQLGKAMQTYAAPIVPPGTSAEPGQPSFTSAVEQAKAARAEFQKIADRYGRTDAGKIARYMAAVCAQNMGDTKAAEEGLKSVAGSGDAELASLAKLALAGVYRDAGRTKDALPLYQELVAHPTNMVGKPAAQLQLAALYQSSNQDAEAKKLYTEIVKDDPASAAAALANQKLSTGK